MIPGHIKKDGDDKENKPISFQLISLPPEDVLKRKIEHWAFFSERRDKIEDLRKFILAEQPEKALVFTAQTGQVEHIASRLQYRGVACSALHAKMSKLDRKKNLDAFRSGKTKILITSDLSARGLDIPDITHIIQMDVSDNEDFFIHRAGRTARAGKTGINAVFGDERELRELARIEKKLGIIIYPKIMYGAGYVPLNRMKPFNKIPRRRAGQTFGLRYFSLPWNWSRV
ncbi:C-terminal helicase domain-containing protein [Brucepastera parasyntrophica]|uniref:helicase-related protein n=1 Tax=Brucepastera parasyntrophica TaxID=2880008 RepID=UPI00210F1846|nr:C-terminal helicase domain-containing protein [Brucepastera parasyntrophica]ULQ59719.1 C-terminal helicase domain-containing protein [Brucepastera parasyntrophica]